MQTEGFTHGSKEPEQTLRNEIRKNCRGVTHIAPGAARSWFYQPSKGDYALIEWDQGESDRSPAGASATDLTRQRSQVDIAPNDHDTSDVETAVQAMNLALPDEVLLTSGVFEGAIRTIAVNAYERNPEARRRCIAHYGLRCLVCGIDFGIKYGRHAAGFIHVHHLKPLAKIGEQYEVDPIADLRPVCPNCHSVIHLGGECREIEEVKQMLMRSAT